MKVMPPLRFVNMTATMGEKLSDKLADTKTRVRTWLHAHPHFVVDALVALACAYVCYGFDFTVIAEEYSELHISVLTHWYPWQLIAFYIWLIAICLTMATFRTWPKIGTIAGPALLVVHLLVFPTSQSAFVFTCAVVSHLGRYLDPPWRRWVWPALTVGIVLTVLLRPLNYWSTEIEMLLFIIVASLPIQGFFWLWGSNKRRNDLAMLELEERAQFATIAERTRIAREMHDIVAHSLSGIIAQSDGGRYAGKKDPEQAIKALETIGTSARQSLEEMRSILAVLRDEEGAELTRERQSPPGISAIPKLINDTKATGLQLTYVEEGEPYPLSEAEQLTVYRIIQESLTNVIKHAGNVPTKVTLSWTADSVSVTIRNRPPLYRPKTPPPGAQRGITGMEERVKLHGGTLTINALDGFTVTARLPRKK